MPESPPRPLHERSASDTNSNRAPSSTVRLVPAELPKLLGQNQNNNNNPTHGHVHVYGDEVFGRTPLPTHPSHILSPGHVHGHAQGKGIGKGNNRDGTNALRSGFQTPKTSHHHSVSTGSSASSTHPAPHLDNNNAASATGSPNPKPKPVPKKRLRLHKDNKTFVLVPLDEAPSPDEILSLPQSPQSPTLSAKSSIDVFFSDRSNAYVRSNSVNSCTPAPPSSTGSARPSTPTTTTAAEEPRKNKQAIPVDPIASSPWNYQIVGGLRKVQPDTPTPDLKQAVPVTFDADSLPPPRSPSPSPLFRTSDASTQPSHDLSTKLSFQSNQSHESSTTTSDNTNYKVYRDISPSPSEAALVPPSSSDSNYQLLGDPSPSVSESSVIYRPRTAISEAISESYFEDDNYEIHGVSSPAASDINLVLPVTTKYSHESLVVPPLKGRPQRSHENFGYYKQRSRESLRSRTSSFNSINTVLTSQEATQGYIGTGSLITLPPLPPKPTKGTGSWADSASDFSLRSPMQETPHQWSSQLSTVLSVSESGTDRGSRRWSDDRVSSGFPSSSSRHSRHMLSISSSMALPSDDGNSTLEPPRPAFARPSRHGSTSSAPIIEEIDEYGDGITDLQNLRLRRSKSRISGFFSTTSSDNERTNTMRSTASSRANSLLANSIPTWAKLYYGSGEHRYLSHLGAPGSSTESSNNSRSNSFRSGSPNTDHFPLSIYSPRRRPREIVDHGGIVRQGSLEITPSQHLGSDGQLINDPFSRKFRTWSMSSIWSPHLRLDRRATRPSMWEPPSVNWSADNGWFGRRNVQIVMFVTGFVFPFSWFIGAILPLPTNPMKEMQERESSTSNLGEPNEAEIELRKQLGPQDEAKYESARWWRRLNRWMSIFGVLLVAAVIAVVVVSILQKW